MSSPLLVDHPRTGVVRARLDRPERRNAVDLDLLAALTGMFGGLGDPHTDADAARVVVLSSTEPAVFCAGADLTIPDDERERVSRGLYDLYRTVIDVPVPVIAVLTGPAVGGGAQLAAACDLRVAHPQAWLRFVGPGHGLAVGGWALPSLVGRGRAEELCLTGRRVDAAEGVAIGLVTHVDPEPDRRALELAAGVVDLDPGAVARTKQMAVAGLHERLDREAAGNAGWSGHAPGPRGADRGPAPAGPR
jgi:enoyl-CoA hydratase/carnithine racemase